MLGGQKTLEDRFSHLSNSLKTRLFDVGKKRRQDSLKIDQTYFRNRKDGSHIEI